MKLLKKSALFAILAVAVPGVSWPAEGILDYNRFMRDIEPIITTTTFTFTIAPSTTPVTMSCVSCHGVSTSAAYSTFPLRLGQPRENFTEVTRLVSLVGPDTSLILRVPLALAAGGLAHGDSDEGGHQFNNTANDHYGLILAWIVDATQSSVGARVTRSEAYPNPFRFETHIVYVLSTDAQEVDVTIFSMDGHVLRRYEGTSNVGANQILWDGRDANLDPLPTGVYPYSIKAVFDDTTVVHNGSCVYTP